MGMGCYLEVGAYDVLRHEEPVIKQLAVQGVSPPVAEGGSHQEQEGSEH